jgi:hypothetical protein
MRDRRPFEERKKGSRSADPPYKWSKLPGHMLNTTRFAQRAPCGRCLEKYVSAGRGGGVDDILTTDDTIFDLS